MSDPIDYPYAAGAFMQLAEIAIGVAERAGASAADIDFLRRQHAELTTRLEVSGR